MTEDSLDFYADIDTFSPEDVARSNISNDCVNNSEHVQMHTDLWMDDDETLVHPSPAGTFATCASNTDSEQMDLCAMPFRLEPDRIKAEMDIYFELFGEEMNSMKSKFEMVPEFQELRSEVKRLQNLNSEKDAQLSELTTQNITLKKNICSLYKTAKAEDAQKDLLLGELNKKLDRFYYCKNSLSRYGKDKCTQTDYVEKDNAETKVSSRKSKDSINESQEPMKYQNVSTGQKRLLSPHKEDFSAEYSTSAKQSKIDTLDLNAKTRTTSSDYQSRTLEISPGPSGELNMSSNTTETNNLFFRLLPDALKHSFLEYEKSQIVSLNRLKKSFVDHGFMQSKKQALNVNSVCPSIQPDFEATDSPLEKPCNADASISNDPLNQASDLNTSKKSMAEAPSSTVNHNDRLCNGKSHNDERELKNGRRKRSFSRQHEKGSNYRTKEHPYSRALMRTRNFPYAYRNDVKNIYMQRRERMNCLLRQQDKKSR